MNPIKRFFFFPVLLCLFYSCSAAEPGANPPKYRSSLELPYIISSGMVVQQNSQAAIWGKARPKSTITVSASWHPEAVTAETDIYGKWSVKIPTGPGGKTSHTITVSDSDNGRKTISDVLVGEVWMCAGQSNMEMPMRGFGTVAGGNFQPVHDAEQELSTADFPTFRYFKVKYQISTSPSSDTKESVWWKCTPANAREYSAIAFFFGRELTEELDVPVGIIGCSYGGTRIEAWMPEASLSGFSEDEYKDVADLGGDPNHKSAPGVLYNGMVLPISNYTLRGWLWFQGESNRDNYFAYARLMQEMVRSWRAARNDASNEIPFYYVQLHPFSSSDNRAAFMREAQMDALALIPNSGLVCAPEAGSTATIHSPYKQPIAARLAGLALHYQYGRSDIDPHSPAFSSMDISGNKAVITVTDGEGLTVRGGTVTHIQIAGADGNFKAAQASVTPDGKLEVSSPEVASPTAVRYCFSSWHNGTIFNGAGLPLHPFRTDSEAK